MQKGDIVIANHPESDARVFVRSYGIVQEMTESGGVIIELADGSLIKRQFNSVAIYIKLPDNWLDLFGRQQIVYAQPRQQMMAHRSVARKPTT